MRNIVVLLVAVCAISFTSAQTKVGGVELPNSETFGTHKLILNGAGVREKLWIDLYAGGLYLPKKSSNAEAIVNSKDAMAVKLHIVSKLISSKKMIDAVEEGFENSTNDNTGPIRKEIDQFIGLFKDEIQKGDVFDITYQPDRGGVVAYKNGDEKGLVKGMEFKKALFGIWLSNRPADDDLKEAMLGE